MKSNKVKNKNVLSAITIGITAMLALQTPITAYANVDDYDSPDTGNDEPEATQQAPVEETNEYVPITQAAQNQADVALEVCADIPESQNEENQETSQAQENEQTTPEINTNEGQETGGVTEGESTPTSDTTTNAGQETGGVTEGESQSTSENNEGENQTTPTSPSSETQQEEKAPTAENKAEDAANLILNGDSEKEIEAANAEEGSKATQAAISKLIDAADSVVNDKTDEEGNVDSAATSSYVEAAEKIAEAKSELVEAEDANKEIESSYTEITEETKEVVEEAAEAISVANDMIETTDEAKEKAEELVGSIENAASVDDAEKVYDELTKLVADTKSDLETRKILYDSLNEKYDAAVAELEKSLQKLDNAEEKFDGAMIAASGAAKQAESEVKAAQQKVDNLAAALNKVEEKLADENLANNMTPYAGNETIDWSQKLSKKIDDNREVMRNVIVNYYMPKIMGIDVVVESVDYKKDFQHVKGFDGQEYNYTEFNYTYRDKDGNLKTGKSYFNWDSIAKLSNTSTNINNEGIVIFEKTEDEIKANEEVAKYYKKNPTSEINNKNQAFNDGLLDVYLYYDENDEKKYIVAAQLDKLGEGRATKDANGNYLTYDGITLKKIVQNQNNLLHDGNCLIIANDNKIDKYLTESGNTQVYNKIITDNGDERLPKQTVDKIIANSKGLNEFIINTSSSTSSASLLAKYAQYKEAT